MRKIALRGLIGQKRNTLLLWSVVALAFLFLVLSTTLITSLNKTDEEQRRSTYGSWQIMVSDSELTGADFSDENGMKYESMIDESITTSFSVRTITLSGGKFSLDRGATVYVVTEGNGLVVGDGYREEICKGDYFLVPDAAKNKYKIIGDSIKITECYA